jgi:hypothetical protein
MRFSTALVVLLYVVVGSEAMHAKSSTSSTLSYWHLNLPTTPIPDTLRELISPLSSEKTSELLDAIREGKKVSMGEPDPTSKLGRKGGPDGLAIKASQRNYGSAADDADIIADPFLSTIYFLEKDLHTGTKLTLYSTLLKRSSPDSRVFFLPRRLAEAIPFSSDKLSVALEKLDISQGSDTALAMKQTLKGCEGPANSWERKYCATSLESMIDYATSTLGTSSLNVLETNVPCKLESQKYTITRIPFQSKSGSKALVCHSETYAYAVYYCHESQHITTARVSLKGEDGSSGEGVAVCHMDTSGWNPQHLAFKVLKVKPGGAPVCHFVPNGEVLWLPAH